MTRKIKSLPLNRTRLPYFQKIIRFGGISDSTSLIDYILDLVLDFVMNMVCQWKVFT